MKTSMNIAAPQTTSSGPKCLSGGTVHARGRGGRLHEHLRACRAGSRRGR